MRKQSLSSARDDEGRAKTFVDGSAIGQRHPGGHHALCDATPKIAP
jgi:hypothetical protein